jgi:hypothetical protein
VPARGRHHCRRHWRSGDFRRLTRSTQQANHHRGPQRRGSWGGRSVIFACEVCSTLNTTGLRCLPRKSPAVRAAVTAEDQTRFHLTTELAVTKQSLASFVEQEIKISLAGQLSLSTTIWNTFGDADAGTRGSNSGEPSATSCSTCRY